MSKNRKFNEYIIPPGETIKELLESRNITQLDLSLKTGINKKTIRNRQRFRKMVSCNRKSYIRQYVRLATFVI